jgi:hypothetical protein
MHSRYIREASSIYVECQRRQKRIWSISLQPCTRFDKVRRLKSLSNRPLDPQIEESTLDGYSPKVSKVSQGDLLGSVASYANLLRSAMYVTYMCKLSVPLPRASTITSSRMSLVQMIRQAQSRAVIMKLPRLFR